MIELKFLFLKIRGIKEISIFEFFNGSIDYNKEHDNDFLNTKIILDFDVESIRCPSMHANTLFADANYLKKYSKKGTSILFGSNNPGFDHLFVLKLRNQSGEFLCPFLFETKRRKDPSKSEDIQTKYNLTKKFVELFYKKVELKEENFYLIWNTTIPPAVDNEQLPKHVIVIKEQKQAFGPSLTLNNLFDDIGEETKRFTKKKRTKKQDNAAKLQK